MTRQKQFFSDIGSPFLKGIGQIMLQNNVWTGLCFLAGICCGSYVMGIAVVLAVMTGTFTAKLLKYPENEVNNGLYGFSAGLVGVALISFFQPTMVIWIAIIIGSALATAIQRLFMVQKIPGFTFPFIVVTWSFLCLFHCFPSLMQPQTTSINTYANDYLALFSHSFGQVIFQDNIWSGILFAIGVFISRPIAAVYAVAGIVLSSAMACLLKEPVNAIYLGLLSYNAVLCAIAFAGEKLEDLVMGLIAVVLSVLVMIQMRYLDLPALTFPFVLASWLVLILKAVK